jgi:hypothetical protein
MFLIDGRAAQRNALPGQNAKPASLGIFLPPVEEEGTTSLQPLIAGPITREAGKVSSRPLEKFCKMPNYVLSLYLQTPRYQYPALPFSTQSVLQTKTQ